MNADGKIKSLPMEALFQRDRFLRFLLADQLESAADMIESLHTRLALRIETAQKTPSFLMKLSAGGAAVTNLQSMADCVPCPACTHNNERCCAQK